MGSILRKHLFISGLFAIFSLVSTIGSAQGFEDFANSNAGAGYTNGSFAGNDGWIWSYVASRNGNGDANGSGINLPALMLRRASDGSKVTSSEIPNGIGNFSVKLYKGFTSNSNRKVELFVNGISQGVSIPFNDYDEHIFEVNGINISGNVIIEIRNITANQVIVDDITWTAFEGGGNTHPVITNIIQVPTSNNVTSSDPVAVSADLIDSDGIAHAELRWGTVSGIFGNAITMNLVAGSTYSTVNAIPAQTDGTTVYYEIEATDGNAVPATTISSELSYTVSDPISFELPYYNSLRNQDDLDGALASGFGLNNVTVGSGAGGYIRIANGSIISPIIDFSLYNDLTVIFDMRTYGGNTGQELSVSVSNDNGASYTSLVTLAAPSDYETFLQLIDLSSLNGTNGRIKFQMTGGTNSIRFRELSMIAEFQGFFYSNGNWNPNNPNGVSTIADDLYIVNGTASLTVDTSVRKITINRDASLKVRKVLTIGGNIATKGNLIFVSTAAGNGELAAVPSGSTITGNVTVHRYMSNNRSYRVLSSAVTTTSSIHANWQEGATSNIDNPAPSFGTHITGSTIDQENGFDGTTTGDPSMFKMNYSNQALEAIDNTDVNTLTAGEARLMFARGDRSLDLTNNLVSNETVLRATGSLHIGEHIQNFPTVNRGDFAMFGNPYQSAIDVISVFENTNNLNTGYYYVYDPNLGNHGAFVTIDLSEENGTNTSGSVANKYLQPGQGGYVATSAAGSSSIVFNEVDKAQGNFTATSRNSNQLIADNMLTVQLYTAQSYNNSGPVHDSFGIIFAEGNDNNLTLEDAVKPMNLYENLGIDHSGTYLSLERREMPQPQPTEFYPLYIAGYQSTDYVLKFTLNGLEHLEITLNDSFTGENIFLMLGEDTTYNFSIEPNDPLSLATNRFSIHVGENLKVNDNNLLSSTQLYPNPLNGNVFFIKAPKLNGEQLSVRISDLRGRSIFNHTFDCSANTVTVPIDNDLVSGIYLVTLTHEGESCNYKLVRE